MANEFLFELGCEELPSAAVKLLAEGLTANLLAGLAKAQIHYGEVRTFATPRRMAVLIADVDDEQPSQIVTRRGPALVAAYNNEGQPTPALLGFAKSCGVAIEHLTVSKTDKGEWLVYEARQPGAKTKELLPSIIKQALTSLPIAKPMRWGDGEAEFARPVHWAVLLFADQVIPCEILGVSTSANSFGHRFHHPQAVKIDKAKNYESLLHEAFVIADFTARRNLIIEQVKQLATQLGAEAVMPDELVDEVTAIVEWPEALLGNFDSDFLQVPPEALIASMQAHQKCFALQNGGNLLPHFITVANISSSHPAQVVAGNEKVMRARLSDAAFFFHQDQKQPLSHHIPATDKVVFQAQLGSMRDKATRLEHIMEFLAGQLNLDKQHARRAAELSKCDLMTGMVGEFPDLQGLMGYYYAHHDHESEDVAVALNEQYMPRFAGDKLPTSKLGLALSLADRLDTLVGIFAIGQKPSGDKDPFKLRRHALAVVRILIDLPTRLNLSELIDFVYMNYVEKLDAVLLSKQQGIEHGLQKLKQICSDLPDPECSWKNRSKNLEGSLKPFILERMQSHYHSYGITIDLVSAVRARQEDWLFDFDKRIHALAAFIKRPEAAILSAACKRVHNILQQAEHTSDKVAAVDENRLTEEAEKALFAHLQAVEQLVKPLYAQEDYAMILTQLASLREPVDAFFDHVMVMVDNQAIKNNRLNLLARMQNFLQGVADISLLQLTGIARHPERSEGSPECGA